MEDKSAINILEDILVKSELSNLFDLKMKDDNTNEEIPFVAYRVKPNFYRIRAFELWGNKDDNFFRVYHAKKISEKLKDRLTSFKEVIKSTRNVVDYKASDYIQLAMKINSVLLSDEIINDCKNTSTLARTSKFEGLELPDIDTSQDDVIGQTFTWRDIISIWEDDAEDNVLKKRLAGNGIYIQRSKDGKSRYIGSAYGSEGIIGRWMKHLNSNGDAQHLNLFVLEHGYNEVLFSVIEFYEGEDIIRREKIWKQILGTINYGSYNGIQLNNN